MQLIALMLLLAIYFLYLILITPMRNPFLQQEILFTGALFLMFGLLYAAFDSSSANWNVFAIGIIQCTVVGFMLFTMILFREDADKRVEYWGQYRKEMLAAREMRLQEIDMEAIRPKKERPTISAQCFFQRSFIIKWGTLSS